MESRGSTRSSEEAAPAAEQRTPLGCQFLNRSVVDSSIEDGKGARGELIY